MDWSHRKVPRYFLLDTGQEFTSLPLVSHRVGRWVEIGVGGGVKSSCTNQNVTVPSSDLPTITNPYVY